MINEKIVLNTFCKEWFSILVE